MTHARLPHSLVAGFARVARVPAQRSRSPGGTPARKKTTKRYFSHAVVEEVIRQVPHARVAVPALDVLVVRSDDDARRGLAHEQADVVLSFGPHNERFFD